MAETLTAHIYSEPAAPTSEPAAPTPEPPVRTRLSHIDDNIEGKTPFSQWLRLLVTTTTLLMLILFVGVVVRLGMGIHHTLLLFALGGLVAYALDPLVERLRHPVHGKSADPSKGLSRKASVAIVFLGLIALLGFGFWSLGGHLEGQVRTFQEDAPQYRQRALVLAANADQQLAAHHIKFSVTETIQHPPGSASSLGKRFGASALDLLKHFVTDAGESVIVLLIALYFLLFGADMKEKFNALLPPTLLKHVKPWQADINRILGGFVRGQVIIALVMGAAAALGLLLIGVHLWLLIGLIVVVAALIPVFGPYIGALPAVLAALIGPTHIHSPIASAAAVLVLFIVINEAGSKILYPKLVGQALGLHEVFVLFVLFAGLEIDGIVGTLFAAPVAALSIVTIVHLYRLWIGLPEDDLADMAKRDGPEQAKAKLA